MAFVVETGSGLSSANSYLSVADADSYLADYGNSSSWSSATDASKEEALRMATRYLDAVYLRRWKGRKSTSTQALDWPRLYVEDNDGFTISSSSIPQALKDATAEMALRHLTETDGILPDLDEAVGISKESVTVGPITESIEYAGVKGRFKTFSIVERLIDDLIEAPGYVERG